MSDIDSSELDLIPTAPASSLSAAEMAVFLHELRNPIATVQTLAKLLQKRLTPEDPNYQVALNISQECQHLNSLLRQWEYRQSPPPRDPLDLVDWMAELGPIYETLASSCGLEFSLNCDPRRHYPRVCADPLALRQVVDNLIDNACKYSTPGGRIQMSLDLIEDPRRLQLRVTDTGRGIAPTDLSSIFVPFVRYATDQPGQGLGLAISRQLIQRMGGEIQVSSQPGQGSQFTIQLPVLEQDLDPRLDRDPDWEQGSHYEESNHA